MVIRRYYGYCSSHSPNCGSWLHQGFPQSSVAVFDEFELFAFFSLSSILEALAADSTKESRSCPSDFQIASKAELTMPDLIEVLISLMYRHTGCIRHR